MRIGQFVPSWTANLSFSRDEQIRQLFTKLCTESAPGSSRGFALFDLPPQLLRFALSSSFALWACLQAASIANAQTYSYSVRNWLFGDLGTYSNTIETKAGITEVHTLLHIEVPMIHHEDASRIERWIGGRLIYFDGVTTDPGGSLHIHGAAQGEKFVVVTPWGQIEAPSDLFPSNPWSQDLINARTMMAVKTGSVEPVSITGGPNERVTIDKREIEATCYKIASESNSGSICFDKGRVPVEFRVRVYGFSIVFTLKDYPPPRTTRSDAVPGK